MDTNLAIKLEERFIDNVIFIDPYMDQATYKDYSRYKESSTKIINKIYNETEKFWKNKKAIRDAMMDIDQFNVYDFVKNMSIMSDSGEVFSEVRCAITSLEVYNVVYSLLRCAREFDLKNSGQYHSMSKECKELSNIVKKHPRARISSKSLKNIDKKLIRLCKAIDNKL